MPAEFDHVLLTRFSAVLSPGAPPAGEDWLRYRLGFFYDATYPSVQSQTTADFHWLVLFDDRCSDAFRAEIEDLAAGVFRPLWSHEPFRRDSFAAPVAALTDRSDPAPYLITTRLDSDDALAWDYLAAVQEQFDRQPRLFVSFTRGVQIDRSGAVYLSDSLSNPFLSLIEQRTPGRLPQTVYVAKHARARAHGPVREVHAPVMWAQVVHDLNVSNIVNGTRTAPGIVGRRFRMDLGYDDTIHGASLLAGRLRHANRLVRLWVAHPGELTKFTEAKAWRLRGTHLRAQDDGGTLSDRVQTWDRDSRERWRTSALRARLKVRRDSARRVGWQVQQRVNEALGGRLRPVAGDVDALLSSDRVAVIAEYARRRRVRPDALAAAAAYAAAGVPALVVAARDAWVPRLTVPEQLPEGVAVLRRPNVGYDFGTWSSVLAAHPELAEKDLVILTNDSLAGPFGPLDELVGRIEHCEAEVWAPTATLHPAWHLHSYLLAFRRGVLARQSLATFFAGVRPQPTKGHVIRAYEIGLSRALTEHGVTWQVGWSADELGLAPHSNAAYLGWQALLEAGFPFVKRNLLEASRFADQRGPIAAVVRQRYGVTL